MVERQRARETCVDDAAETPNVARESVRLLVEYFRCYVPKRAKWLRGSITGSNNLSETKVNNFRDGIISAVRHHNVL